MVLGSKSRRPRERTSAKWREDPLVAIDRRRLEVALRWHRRKSRASIAKQAGLTPQKLDYLVKGTNRRCRQSARGKLARVLGCSVAYLGGAKGALPPGILAEEYQTLRSEWLKRTSVQTAHALSVAELSGGVIFERIEALRAAHPQLDASALEARAVEET